MHNPYRGAFTRPTLTRQVFYRQENDEVTSHFVWHEQNCPHLLRVFFSVSILEDLSGTYERADAEVKKLLVGSIFSEKLCFDGKKYRTAPLNPAIELMASNIKSFKRAKKRQASKNRDLSSLAPPPGLEPGTY